MVGMRQTVACIRLDSFVRNVMAIRRLIGPRTRLLAVVKADGYGHGAISVARKAVEAGAFGLAVGIAEEGIELREAGISAPILVMGDVPGSLLREAARAGLTMTVFDFAQLRDLEVLSYREEKSVPVHLKVDTGMGRLGVSKPDEVVRLARELSGCKAVRLEGIYTHFSSADEPDPGYTLLQLERFRECLNRLERAGVYIPLKHVANSAAAIRYPESRFDLVRVGLALYGVYPDGTGEGDVELEPVLSWKSHVSMVKEVEAGSPVSYNRTYVTPSRKVLATIPVGYADGYMRCLSNRGFVLVNGQECPVVGRVCMDQLVADVTGVTGVRRGTEVVLIGRQGDRQIRVEDIAEIAGTISYEILCGVSKRVPRVYIREKEGNITTREESTTKV